MLISLTEYFTSARALFLAGCAQRNDPEVQLLWTVRRNHQMQSYKMRSFLSLPVCCGQWLLSSNDATDAWHNVYLLSPPYFSNAIHFYLQDIKALLLVCPEHLEQAPSIASAEELSCALCDDIGMNALCDETGICWKFNVA